MVSIHCVSLMKGGSFPVGLKMSPASFPGLVKSQMWEKTPLVILLNQHESLLHSHLYTVPWICAPQTPAVPVSLRFLSFVNIKNKYLYLLFHLKFSSLKENDFEVSFASLKLYIPFTGSLTEAVETQLHLNCRLVTWAFLAMLQVLFQRLLENKVVIHAQAIQDYIKMLQWPFKE